MKAPNITTLSQSIGSFIDSLCSRKTIEDAVIIACCSKSYFLEQLLEYAAPSEAANIDDQDRINIAPYENSPNDGRTSVRLNLRLVLPTLRTLATSSRVKLVFCPNVSSFRAYMSTLPIKLGLEDDSSPKVIVVDMLAMHNGTSEFTVQGLSRTFAMLASVNASLPRTMRIVECVDFHNPTNSDRGPRLWQHEVPLLSGSVKIGQAGQAWAARTISIKRFAARWFELEEEARS